MLNKYRLIWDPASTAESDQVGAHVLAGDDGTQIGHVGDALKVDIGAVTDLDIRDLDASQDNVAISDGTHTLDITAAGHIPIDDGGNSITVDAIDLDIRDLTAASDSVQSNLFDGAGTALTSTLVSGKQALDVRLAEGVNLEVDLSHVDDSVRLGDGTTLTNVSTDGSLQTVDRADTAVKSSTESVTTTAAEIASTALAERRRMIIQNVGGKDVYLGASGVTAANGLLLPRDGVFEMDLGPNNAIYGITSSSTSEIRVFEAS